MRYTELHAHSHWSLLEGASSPLDLALQVQDTRRIDDERWQERPVGPVYRRLALEDGRAATVYRDVVSGRWWQQGY